MPDLVFKVSESDVGERLDLYLTNKLQKTRSSITKLIKDGFITLNGLSTKHGYRLKAGDIIKVSLPEEKEASLIPQPISIEVLYRDDYIIVVNKPPGLVMYPSAGHPDGTLMNAIAHISEKLSTVGAPLRPGVVHRLDKETSGVVVIAIDDRAYHGLVKQFKERTVEKVYLTIVYGDIGKEEGTIELPIGRSKTHRKKMSTKTERPKEALTQWKILERLHNATLLRVYLKTGRTHQIRVHFSAIGHPVLGDTTYGRKKRIEINHQKIVIPRVMLHARSLGIVHPIREEKMVFTAPIPEDMDGIIRRLRMVS